MDSAPLVKGLVLPKASRGQPSSLEVSLNRSAAAPLVTMPATRAKKNTEKSFTIEAEVSDKESEVEKVPSVDIIESKSIKKISKRSQRITRSHLSIINNAPTVDAEEEKSDLLPESVSSQSDNLKNISCNLSDKENISKPEKKKRGRKQNKLVAENSSLTNVSDTKISDINIDEVAVIEEQTVPILPKRKSRKTNKSKKKNADVQENIESTDKPDDCKDEEKKIKNSNPTATIIATPLKRESTYIISENGNATDGEKVQSNTKKLTFREASPCRIFKTSNSASFMITPPKSFCRSISVGSAGKTPMPPLFKNSDTSEDIEINNVHKRSLLSELESDTKPITNKRVFAAASPCRLFKKSKPSDSMVLKTPPKTICRTISVGSAGRTPMPPLEKKTDEKSTPKKEEIVLNVTHSIEKNTQKLEKPVIQKPKVRFTSPIFNHAAKPESKTKIPTKMSSTRGLHKINKGSVLKEHERKKTRGITKLPKKTMTSLSEAKGKKIVNLIRSTCTSTPTAQSVTKPAQPVSRSKMPNFASLHKKQFEQMESIIQNKTRREERAKKLLFAANTPNSQRNVKTEKIITDKDQRRTNDYSRFGFKPISDSFKTLPNVSYQDSPKTKSNVMTKVQEQTKNKTKKTKSRDENKDYIVGVRTNRRFELQMKSRNINI